MAVTAKEAQQGREVGLDRGEPILDRPGASAHLQRGGGEEASAGEDAALHVAEEGLTRCGQLAQAGRGGERRLHDLLVEDPLRLLHGGQLQLLLGPEVRVETALADAGRRREVSDGQALQPVDGGQRRGGAQDRLAGALPVCPGPARPGAALARGVGRHG